MSDSTSLSAGTWNIDPAHSTVGFTVRHLVVSKVRGKFGTFSGTITVGDDPTSSSVVAEIDASSISTGDDTRDGHLRSPDFFGTDTNPTWTFTSTSVTGSGSDFKVVGDLTIKGATHPVTLDLEYNGETDHPMFGTRAGFSASTEINRKDFGVSFDVPADGTANVVVGDKVKIELDIEATKA